MKKLPVSIRATPAQQHVSITKITCRNTTHGETINLEGGEAKQEPKYLRTDVFPTVAPPQFSKMRLEQETVEEIGTPIAFVSVFFGVFSGVLAVIIGWYSGFKFLPLVAVYCAVGSAVTLASVVVLALISSMKQSF